MLLPLHVPSSPSSARSAFRISSTTPCSHCCWRPIRCSRAAFDLNFAQIGLITLAFTTASLLQPLVGRYTDRHPAAVSLAAGMGFTLTGLLLLSMASSFPVPAAGRQRWLAFFHPGSPRAWHVWPPGGHTVWRTIFQVGGNASFGPSAHCSPGLDRAAHGQKSLALLSLIALLGMIVLTGSDSGTTAAPPAE